MEDISLLASLLSRLNENQIALGAAVEELSKWVGERGSTDVAENVSSALDALDRNAGFITMALISISAEGKRSS
ncbi:hypothetical protein KKQ10_22755 [Pseudomonas sp. MG-9]|uniref:hypothetical protein n=1 Tax=unclassified Pseudomonas TaxID=196821 RepID=UPI001C00834D|nr:MULTISPECIES: hypothetical protein [unclassified Pseudomonas]MBT9267705.1 hypothetical protein [Pseudomonas sp. MG-9]UVK87453.1 hypothetical protein LOY52_21725 [Pseudomonas sp. B21-051]